MEPTLLDTDVLSEVLKQRNPLVNQRATDYLSVHQSFSFSEYTWFEVQRGLFEKNALLQIDNFANFTAHCSVKPLDRKTFGKAAELWSEARQNGKPHSDADILIAAAALVHGLTLATGNTRHYDWIKDLKLDNWRV